MLNLVRFREEGELEGIEALLTAALPAVIQVSGTLGSAAITADAAKYSARQQESAIVTTALLDAQTEQKRIEADASIQRTQIQATGQGLSQGAQLGFLAFLAWLAFRD